MLSMIQLEYCLSSYPYVLPTGWRRTKSNPDENFKLFSRG